MANAISVLRSPRDIAVAEIYDAGYSAGYADGAAREHRDDTPDNVVPIQRDAR